MNKEEEYNLIHKENNLNEILFQFKKVGYEPYIKYQAGRITELKAKYTDRKTKNQQHISLKHKTYQRKK